MTFKMTTLEKTSAEKSRKPLTASSGWAGIRWVFMALFVFLAWPISVFSQSGRRMPVAEEPQCVNDCGVTPANDEGMASPMPGRTANSAAQLSAEALRKQPAPIDDLPPLSLSNHALSNPEAQDWNVF